MLLVSRIGESHTVCIGRKERHRHFLIGLELRRSRRASRCRRDDCLREYLWPRQHDARRHDHQHIERSHRDLLGRAIVVAKHRLSSRVVGSRLQTAFSSTEIPSRSRNLTTSGSSGDATTSAPSVRNPAATAWRSKDATLTPKCAMRGF